MDESGQPNVRYAARLGTGAAPQAFTPEEHGALDLINRRIAAAQSLPEAIDFLFDLTRDFSPCDRISVAFVDDTGERLVSHWTRALYEPLYLKPGFAQDLRGSSLAEVIREGAPRLIDDLAVYLAEHPDSPSSRLLVREGVRSSMTCPLRVDGRVVGVLFRSARRPAAYTEHHAALHVAVAERLSQAVEKAYRIEQLTATNRAYLEMLGFVSHELRGPLSTIMMSLDTLLDGYAGPITPKQQEILTRGNRQAAHLLNLIRDYLDLARIEEGALTVKAVPGVDAIQDVVEPAIGLAEAALEGNGMTVERRFPADPVRVSCDPDLLRIVMVNLLGNAAKYGKRGGTVKVTVEAGSARLHVAVWNEGAGFREEDRPALFHKFSRLKVPEYKEIRGTGVGLYTSWRVVSLHGGRMTARSEYGQWAEFGFEIPLDGDGSA
jgi:signal transduction histidine kinase